jgi:lysozyme family protein
MSKFSAAITGLLANESGTLIENDNGRGPSKWGITWDTAEPLQPDWTEETIRGLTEGQATTFYYLHFWQKSNIGLIDDQALANKLLDLSVNMGATSAIKLLQQAADVSPADGILGPATAKAVNALAQGGLVTKLRSVAEQHYLFLVKRNPALEKYLDGWLARLDRG